MVAEFLSSYDLFLWIRIDRLSYQPRAPGGKKRLVQSLQCSVGEWDAESAKQYFVENFLGIFNLDYIKAAPIRFCEEMEIAAATVINCGYVAEY